MAFNKKAHLRANIEAIRLAFILEKEGRKATAAEQDILRRYCGFGALKCILNPARSLADTVYWTKSELELFPMTMELHRIIRDNSQSEQEYRKYFDSLKHSTLTAFYTQPEIISALAGALHESGIVPERFLDPSAGMGAFPDAFSRKAKEDVYFEKDLITGKLLSHLYPGSRLYTAGFETIPAPYNGYFDLVSSNIPFGDTAVFDPAFSGSRDTARRLSAKTLHNYFFIKGVDTLREGGILAFITSQGVMDSPSNKPVREWLMHSTNLVSAVRLPGNLFAHNAGTQVGTDLIILQKNTHKVSLSDHEKAFMETRTLAAGITMNSYFNDTGRIVHTRGSAGKDLYGKPAMVFLHEGGTEKMAATVREILGRDLAQYMDTRLYDRFASMRQENTSREINRTGISLQARPGIHNMAGATTEKTITEIPEKEQQQPVPPPIQSPQQQQPVLSLYDLFGLTQAERTQTAAVNRGARKIPATPGRPAPGIVQAQKPQQQQQQTRPIPRQAGPKNDGNESGRGIIVPEPDLFPYFDTPVEFARRAVAERIKREGKAVYPVFDERDGQRLRNMEILDEIEKLNRENREIRQRQPEEEKRGKTRQEPQPYTGPQALDLKEGSLIHMDGQAGYLSYKHNGMQREAIFNPLELSANENGKAIIFMDLRDTYHNLYAYEAEKNRENKPLRDDLNSLYDRFVSRYGLLNDKKNLALIKMDPAGREILSLERSVAGNMVKADIFKHPVAFSTDEITQVSSSVEALTASLNKYGRINTSYMLSLMEGKSEEELLHELHGRTYYNPFKKEYQVRERFIGGNVVEKAERVERWLQSNPDHEHTQEANRSLMALREAIPDPITFESLDFNFGERWIPAGIYSRYAGYLFQTDVSIHYSASADEFSVSAEDKNAHIYDKFAVKSQSRLYDGISLMRHALHNTTPDITKYIMTTFS